MAETLMAETETITKQYDPFQRKIEFIPVKKPFKSFSNDFHIETLNPTTSEHRQLVSANIQSPQPPSKNSEFAECGLDPELSLGITFRRIVSFCFIVLNFVVSVKIWDANLFSLDLD